MKRLTFYSSLLLLLSIALFAGCSNSDSKHKIYRNIDDLENATIGVLMGSTHDKYITEHYPNAKIIRIDASADLYMALDGGKCDAIVVDGVSHQVARGANPKYGILVQELFREPLGVGFSYDNPKLRDSFNAFLLNIRKSGMYAQIYSKWIDSTATAVMPDLSSIPRSGEPIHVGCTGTSEVFDFIQDGRNAGFDIEIVERFAASIGRPIEYKTINFGGLIAALSGGNVDIIVASITITPERAKQVAFSDAHFASYASVVARSENLPKGFLSIADIQNKTIGVLLGSTQDVYATEHFKNAKILRLEGLPNVVMALKADKCDAGLFFNLNQQDVLRTNPEFAILEENLFPSEFGMCFSNGNQVLVDQYNAFLKGIKSDGTYDLIVERWAKDTLRRGIPEIEFKVTDSRPLVVGTAGDNVPFSFVRDNKLSGIDIEIVTRFAAYLGREVDFKMMTFGGLITSVATGKIDMAANSIMITKERAETVTFGDSYYTVQTSAIVKKVRLNPAHKLSDNSARLPTPKGDGSDLETASIGVMTGSLAEMYLKEHYPNADTKYFDDITDAITALRSNKVKYVMTAFTNAANARRTDANLIILPNQYTHEGAAIAFAKDGDKALLDSINACIVKYKESKLLDDMVQRWISPKDGKYAMVETPKRDGGRVLNVGISASREPMCFIHDQKISGLDCELIERIAYDLGMRVQYSDMKFSALTAALMSGKVDLVISNFTSTPERKKVVDFSEEYFTNPQVLMVMAESNAAATGGEKNFIQKIGDSFQNNLIAEKRYMLILNGLWQTVLISIFSILLGTLLGSLICFMRMNKNKILNGFAKGYIDIMRGTPVLVLLMIVFYVVFAKSDISATYVAILTFAMNFAAYVSEMFRTAIEGVDHGQKEAGIALGFSNTKTFRYIILPQAVTRVLPVFKGEAISLVKMTSVVGYIAVQDLTKASDIIRSRTFDAFFPLIVITIIYFLLAWLLGKALDLLNNKKNLQQ